VVRTLVLAALSGSAVAWAEPPVSESPPAKIGYGVLRQGIGLDLAFAGGLRLHDGDGATTRPWLARARVGALRFDEPSFWSLGVAGQIGPLGSASLGLELQYVEVFHATSVQLGVFPLDTVGGTTIEAQVGWAVLGLEYQRRLSGPRDGDQVLVLVLHVPVGVILQMLKDPPGVVRR
jgi:hypothetical protein